MEYDELRRRVRAELEPRDDVAAAGFRNVLVDEDDTVDLDIVRDILEHRLGEIDRFVVAARRRLESS